MKKTALLLFTFCAAGLSHETLTTTVLFDREIVHILDRHCVMCHAEKGPAFPLETYEQTWLQKRSIRADVIARHMPPWSAVPGYGQFANDNGLTLRETQFMVSWVEGLGPRNAGTVFTNTALLGAELPKEVRAHADFAHWQLGQPQLTRQLPPNTIEPSQANGIKRSVIDLGLASERRLRALEYMPGDRRAVRAAVFTIQETGQWLGSWTPWYGFMSLPKGTAIRLPAGSHVAAEVHYRGTKERVTDQGDLGLFFATEPTPNLVSDLVLEARGEKAHAVTKLMAATSILALRPETTLGVKSIEVSARKPDGGTAMLLFAKDLNPDWPTPYILQDPVSLPAGTDLSVTAYFAKAGEIRLTISKNRK
jgi:hypothetical protein